MKKGKFIVVEGIDNSGKSTIIPKIDKHLQQKGISTKLTRDLGGTPLNEEIREITIKNRDEKVNPLTELLLMYATKSQNLYQIILPNLNEGKYVISDRFTDGSYAYQSYARGVKWDDIKKLEDLTLQGFKPDLIIYLDIDPKIAMKRDEPTDRFEDEILCFFQKVREGYLKRIEENPKLYLKVDANRGLDDVTRDVLCGLEKRLF